jgi:hypothetical protein
MKPLFPPKLDLIGVRRDDEIIKNKMGEGFTDSIKTIIIVIASQEYIH